jgi:hypothetical protein
MHQTPPPAGREQRSAARKTLMVPGLVRIRGFRLMLPCRIIDMSATGAGAGLVESASRIRGAQDLPDAIVLTLVSDRLEVDGVIQWRNQSCFGVRFASLLRRLG